MAKIRGVMGVFRDEHELLNAAKAGRETMGFQRYDAYTPYPVHGLDAAMGVKKSWIPWATFFAGATGCISAIAFEGWTSAIDWPVNIGGKPMFSFPAFVPIMFELTVLFGGLTTLGALLYACGLPKVNPKILHPRITNDRFVLWVPASEKGFSESSVTQFLKNQKAEEVSTVSS